MYRDHNIKKKLLPSCAANVKKIYLLPSCAANARGGQGTKTPPGLLYLPQRGFSQGEATGRQIKNPA